MLMEWLCTSASFPKQVYGNYDEIKYFVEISRSISFCLLVAIDDNSIGITLAIEVLGHEVDGFVDGDMKEAFSRLLWLGHRFSVFLN